MIDAQGIYHPPVISPDDLARYLEALDRFVAMPGIDECTRIAVELRKEWLQQAKPWQLAPANDAQTKAGNQWLFWLFRAGRGSGKTRSMIEDCLWFCLFNPGVKMAAVAPTAADLKKVVFTEGVIQRLKEWDDVRSAPIIEGWNKNDNTLTFPNGSVLYGFSAEVPDSIRGNNLHRAWIEELAQCKDIPYLLEQLDYALRKDKDRWGRVIEPPRIIAATTPLRGLKALFDLDRDPDCITTRAATKDNADNLPKKTLEKLRKRELADPEEAAREFYGELQGADYGQPLPRDKWKPWRRPRLPKPELVIISMDTAFKAKKESDYTACAVIAICPVLFNVRKANARGHEEERQEFRYIALLKRAWKKRLMVYELKEWARHQYEEEAEALGMTRLRDDGTVEVEHDSSRLLCLIEDKGSGQGLLQELERMEIPTFSYNPGNDSKELRAEIAAGPLRQGRLWALGKLDEDTGTRSGTEFEDDVERCLMELDEFPGGEHDDFVDAVSQAVIYYRDQGYLVLSEDRAYNERDPEGDDEPPPRKVVSAYG